MTERGADEIVCEGGSPMGVRGSLKYRKQHPPFGTAEPEPVGKRGGGGGGGEHCTPKMGIDPSGVGTLPTGSGRMYLGKNVT